MASKFMKIKRIIIPMMTLIIMTSQLAGCATMSSDEMLKSMQESPDVSIEYAIPNDEQQSLDATQVIDIGDQQYVSDSNYVDSEYKTESDSNIGVINQQEAKELSGAELEEYFQLAYDSGSSLEGDLETRILGELDILVSLVDADEGSKLPGNYAYQYRSWRPVEAVDPFTEVNEQVWATGTVNLRNGAGTSFEKVGSLNTGDSVTRTGIGTAEAEGWSRIQLSDGSIVYVSSNYISTTKPAPQQQQTSKPSGGNTTQQQQQTQQPSGDTDSWPGVDLPSGTPITGGQGSQPQQPSGNNNPLIGDRTDPDFIDSATKAMGGDLSDFQVISWEEYYGNQP